MQLRYNFRLYPTRVQQQSLTRAFGCARVVFNDALRARQEAHQQGLPYLWRLCHQGLQLYQGGELEIRLPNPQPFLDFGEQVAGGDIDAARALMASYETDFDAVRSPLPDRPDEATVERWLLRVRQAYL